jgi:hypothetical protein
VYILKKIVVCIAVLLLGIFLWFESPISDNFLGEKNSDVGILKKTIQAFLKNAFEEARPEKTVRFGEYKWNVRSSERFLPPGPNRFSRSGVHVDESGTMHMQLSLREDGHWSAAEVVSKQSFGYGTYNLTVEGLSALDADEYTTVVFSVFFFDRECKPAPCEFDIEWSDWNGTARKSSEGVRHNTLFTIHRPPPNTIREESRHWSTTSPEDNPINVAGEDFTTVAITWEKDSLIFKVNNTEWMYTGEDIPSAGSAKIHFNLWMYAGKQCVDDTFSYEYEGDQCPEDKGRPYEGIPPPDGTKPLEIVITKFAYTP